MQPIKAALCAIGLAVAMHLDWHVARPAVHEHSLGLSWHWVFAVPVFALNAWCTARIWPMHVLRASLGIIGVASLLAAAVEPALEIWLGAASSEWAFGWSRVGAFAAFLATGVVAQAVVLTIWRRWAAPWQQAAG